MKVLFSIIIPVYNRGSRINKAIDSVLNQTYTNWELIVVDDGSTDNTKESVLLYSINDERIKYIYQNNAERSVARNNGIKHASGDWICFLDSDDVFKKNHLESIYKRIKINQKEKNKVSFYVTGQETFNTMTQETTVEHNEIPEVDIPYFFAGGSIVPGRVCISRKVLEKHKFDESIVIVEDADLWFRLSCHYQCEYIDEPTFTYYVHDNNSINIRNNVYKTRLDGLLKTFKKPEKKFLTKYKSAISNNVHILPDITNTSLCSKTKTTKRNRQIILPGVANKRKGVIDFLGLAEKPANQNWQFIIAGKLIWDDFTSNEKSFIKNVAKNSNIEITGYIKREEDLNCLINDSDLVYAIYLNFPHSSNIMTKAAAFKVPILVNNDYLMDERVGKYGIGLSKKQSLDLGLDEILLKTKFLSKKYTEFTKMHSKEVLESQLLKILKL